MNPSVHTDDRRFLELLERWAQGDFTRSDERELRALTDADDFRREAWEGFAAMPEADHATRLHALRSRFQRRPGGKRIGLGIWMAAAAVLLVLLVAVYFIPQISRQAAEPVAQTSPVPPANPDANAQPETEPSVAVADEKSPFGKQRSEPSGVVARRDAAPGATAAESQLASDDVNAKLRSDEAPGAPVASTPVADAPPLIGGPAAGQQTNVIVGGPAANLPPAKSPDGGPAGNSGPLKDYATQPAKTESAKPASRAKANDAAKKEAATASALAAPVNGWDNFRDYLYRTARLPDAARNHNVSGNVRLQFTVDAAGRPANFKVLHSLGYGCDEEAIRLINAAAWVPGGPDPVTVDVPFVR